MCFQDDVLPVGNNAESDSVVPIKKRKSNPSTMNISSHGNAKRRYCALCDVPRLETEVRDSSKIRKHNIILFSCLIIENSIDDQLASKAYEEISLRRKRLCKEHYIRAVRGVHLLIHQQKYVCIHHSSVLIYRQRSKAGIEYRSYPWT